MERTILIQPRDPVIFRDGKPFTQGLPARSTDWPLPSAVIGPIRTRMGRNTSYDDAAVKRLKLIEHVGPFMAACAGSGYTLAFPAPADVVAFAARDDAQGRPQLELCPLRPAKLLAGDGMDWPEDGLAPVLGGRGEKPTAAPPFWSAASTLGWLAEGGSTSVFRAVADVGFRAFSRQRRIHLEIETGTQAAKKGMLFSTEGLEFLERGICSRIRYRDDEVWAGLEALAPLGGERRLAYWSEPAINWPAPPDWLADEKLLRLQLITPGYFEKGWKPGWLQEGTPPGLDGLKLKLVAAAVPRAVAHSGWDLTKRGKNGQKATRFLAPAGSVYFCEVEAGDPRRLWMRSISDDFEDGQARRDGFGLVLCGRWQWR